jgi:hypothetical protein
MKRILLLLGLILTMSGCITAVDIGPGPASMPADPEYYNYSDTVPKDVYGLLLISLLGMQEPMEILIPKYALQLVRDADMKYVNLLSPNIIMIYFDKEGPNIQDPGHAVAVIIDIGKEYYKPLFFQTTVKEEQRFFYYDYNEDMVIPIETNKPTYRYLLERSVHKDKNENPI